jgi:hypothetical protein
MMYAKTVEEKETLMKRFAFLLIASLAFVLNGCLIEIVDTGLPSGVTISNARYQTSFSATVNGQPNKSIICDNKETTLSYSFQFSGNLGSWTSYIKGNLGSVVGRQTLDLSSNFVLYDSATRTVTVTYTLRAGSAPLLLAPQTITVTPIPNPTVIGKSKLYLEFPNTSRAYAFSTDELPVVTNCP